MLVNPSVPAKTVPEFIAYAKANPDKVNMASAGNGRRARIWPASCSITMAGVKMVHVPYRGPGSRAHHLLGGQVQVLFATTPGTADYIKSGKLRALAVTTASRIEMPCRMCRPWGIS